MSSLQRVHCISERHFRFCFAPTPSQYRYAAAVAVLAPGRCCGVYLRRPRAATEAALGVHQEREFRPLAARWHDVRQSAARDTTKVWEIENFFQWIIKDLGHGRVSIKSVSSGLYLDGRDTGVEEPWLSSADRKPKEDPYLQWIVVRNASDGRATLQSVSSTAYLSGMVNPLLSRWTTAQDLDLQWEINDLFPTARLVSIMSVSSSQFLNGRAWTSALLLSPPTTDRVEDPYFQWVVTKLDSLKVSIKSVSSGHFLDGRDFRMQEPLIAWPDRLPLFDKYLQWYIADVREGRSTLQSVSSTGLLNGRDPGMQGPWLSYDFKATGPPTNDPYLQWIVWDITSEDM